MPTEQFEIRWTAVKTPSGVEYQRLIGGWNIAPDRFLHILKSVDMPLRQKVENVLNTGWEKMSKILAAGGVVTSLGSVIPGDEPGLQIPESLLYEIDAARILTYKGLKLKEDYSLDIDAIPLDRNEYATFLAADVQSHMFNSPEFGPLIHTDQNKGRKIDHLIRSFTNMFLALYKEAQIHPVVAAHSATNSMLAYTAEQKGQGLQANIRPERLY